MQPRLGYFYVAQEMRPDRGAAPPAAPRDARRGTPCPGDPAMLLRLGAVATTALAVAALAMWALG